MGLLNAVNVLSANYETKSHSFLQQIEELKHTNKKQAELLQTVNGKVNTIKYTFDGNKEGATADTRSPE